MNRKQRDKNRTTAANLEFIRHTCPECGTRGKHWVQFPTTPLSILLQSENGFWTCDKFYAADGRRIS